MQLGAPSRGRCNGASAWPCTGAQAPLQQHQRQHPAGQQQQLGWIAALRRSSAANSYLSSLCRSTAPGCPPVAAQTSEPKQETDQQQESEEGEAAGPPSEAARRSAYYSLAAEQSDEVEATVSGAIPNWLQGGTYVRNGPGDFTGATHLFDGLALLAKFRFGAGSRVYATHRFLRTQAFEHARKTGQLRWREFASGPPRSGAMGVVAGLADMALEFGGLGQALTDNASVSLMPIGGGEALALTEALPGTYRVSLSSLETLGKVQYDQGDGVPGNLTTAHPKLMPDGSIVNMTSAIGTGYVFYRQPRGGNGPRETLAVVPHRHKFAPAWVHDFAVVLVNAQDGSGVVPMAVLVESPMYFSLASLLTGRDTDHVFMDWRPEEGSRFHLVPLDGRGKPVRTFSGPPFFAFHYLNAHEAVEVQDQQQQGSKQEQEQQKTSGGAAARAGVAGLESAGGSGGSGVIDKGGGGGREYGTSARPASGTRRGRRVVHLDVSLYRDPAIVNELYLWSVREEDPAREVSQSYLRRFTLPLEEEEEGGKAGSRSSIVGAGRTVDAGPTGLGVPLVRDEEESGAYYDFPAMNPSLYGQPYRYAWGGACSRPTSVGNALVKVDTATGSALRWHERGCITGEPVFVPRPRLTTGVDCGGGCTADTEPGAAVGGKEGHGGEEDDGVLLSANVDEQGRSFLLVLDAATMVELGRATLPYGLPSGFHGAFVWPDTA